MLKISKKVKSTVIVFLLMIISSFAFGQSDTNLTRRELAVKAIENSHSVKIKQNEAKASHFDKQRALYTYIPKVGVKGGYAYLLNDITISRDISGTKNQALYGLEHSKNQSLAQLASSGLPPTMIGVATPLIEGVYNNIGGMVNQIPNTPSISIQDNNFWFYDAYVEMVIFSGLQAPTYAKAAEAKSEAQQAMVEQEKNEIIMETLSYYDKMAVVNQSLKVLEESQKRLDKQTEFANKAKEVGLATEYDLNKIRIAEKDIVAKRIELEASKSLVIQKLQQLTGLDQGDLAKINPELTLWMVDENEINLSNRNEIKALEHSIEALEYKHKGEQYGALPKAKAFAHVIQGGTNMTNVDAVPFVGVAMQWEIFDGLQRKREVQKSELAVISMKEKKAYAQDLVQLDFQKKKMEWQVATQMVDVSNQKLDGAKTGLKIKVQEAKNGLTDVTDVLDEISEYEKFQLEYIQSIANQRQTAIALINAMGVLNIEHIQN
ncbi:TolC family protein [Flammeovirga kamogawensis]|uniref:TolC family protein n=2 Tax=Flammeovirga kamogawensis TaxID=373891 RepID=A0ABX8GVX7_9BACT|nr:TolC family protein [Flammeovirga kamogawensis]QWG07753.1 TolC family protein [Flammeovirga kamogawensis]TRX69559.1 TolC family protein [Flammeovirga kamogawensis]